MATRAIGIGKETSYGEDVAPTSWISAIDENMSEDMGILAEEEMGQRGPNKPVAGPFAAKGGFKAYLEPDNMGLVMKAACMGLSSAVVAGSTYKHTYIPGTTPTYLTMAVVTGVTAGQKTYPGYAVQKAKFSFEAKKKVLVDVSGFAKTINLDALGSPSFSTLDPFVFHQATAKIATVGSTIVKNLTVEIENMFYNDDYILGSQFLGSAPIQGLKVSGAMDMLFDSLTEYKRFLGGDGAQTSPQTAPKKVQLDCDIDSGVDAGDGTNYQFNAELKECIYKTHKANVSRQDRTVENVEYEAYVPTTGNLFTLELVNLSASY